MELIYKVYDFSRAVFSEELFIDPEKYDRFTDLSFLLETFGIKIFLSDTFIVSISPESVHSPCTSAESLGSIESLWSSYCIQSDIDPHCICFPDFYPGFFDICTSYYMMEYLSISLTLC